MKLITVLALVLSVACASDLTVDEIKEQVKENLDNSKTDENMMDTSDNRNKRAITKHIKVPKAKIEEFLQSHGCTCTIIRNPSGARKMEYPLPTRSHQSIVEKHDDYDYSDNYDDHSSRPVHGYAPGNDHGHNTDSHSNTHRRPINGHLVGHRPGHRPANYHAHHLQPSENVESDESYYDEECDGDNEADYHQQ